MLQRVINENLYNKKANIPVIEEQEVVNDYDDVINTKGFQQIKKIVNSYDYYLASAFVEKYRSTMSIHFDIREDNKKLQPSISYDSETNEFKISPWSYGSMNLKKSELFADAFDNALQLCKKLSKMDLLHILPILEYK